jgi:hypothetical protein
MFLRATRHYNQKVNAERTKTPTRNTSRCSTTLPYLLTFWFYGPPTIFASLTTGGMSYLIRHVSLGLLPYTILRGEVHCLTPHSQPGEPRAKFRLAPTCCPVYHGRSYQELIPSKHSSPDDQSKHTTSLR